MEKNEKLKALAAVAEGFGLTREEAAAYFGKNSARSEETEDASVQSEESVSADVVCPGMYYHSDGTISTHVIQGKQISGVVGWVDDSGRHGLVLGLREKLLAWSYHCRERGVLQVNLPRNADGRKNTRLILDAVQKESKRACAAEWCAAYVFDGIHFEEAFLPSRDELIKIFKNINRIQAALERIGRPLCRDAVYWSSSEYYNVNNAWVVRPSDGGMDYYYKDYHNRVRCVLAF